MGVARSTLKTNAELVRKIFGDGPPSEGVSLGQAWLAIASSFQLHLPVAQVPAQKGKGFKRCLAKCLLRWYLPISFVLLLFDDFDWEMKWGTLFFFAYLSFSKVVAS
jgi:hypothetical protein